jgi:predicted ABC-class ATPase
MMSSLSQDLQRLDGRPFPAYRDLRGREYVSGAYKVTFEHIQGDPFAAPSRISVSVPPDVPVLPGFAYRNADARRGSADFLHRAISRTLKQQRSRSGSGKSGLLEIADLGQEVLDRTALRVGSDGSVLVRLSVGLPAAGRRILGRAAAALLAERLPALLDEVITRPQIDTNRLGKHVRVVEDQVALRSQLAPTGLVGFLAAGSVLPRRSGADDRPMQDGLPLRPPPSLTQELFAPHAGAVLGLAIPRGVTLIAGGGYHGKSTLLSTMARCVYDHIPGDGREQCVTDTGAVSIRAEDGRAVRAVDLNPFIRNLPLGRSTNRFDTDDASGSTSQAAAIVEALEVGATALFVDEDTAATNFMIRDPRMRRLVPGEKEPITPYLDRVHELAHTLEVSSVLVIGGAGDYLDVADLVIQMDEYQPVDVTERARQVARALPLERDPSETLSPWTPPAPRIPDPASIDPSRGRRAERVRSIRTRVIEFGTEEIDVSLLAQLVDPAQCRCIGDILLHMSRGWCDGQRSIAQLLDFVERRIDSESLERVTAPTYGDRARPRRFEIAAAMNRLRSLRIL